MLNDEKPLQIRVETIHATTDAPLTDVGVEVVTLEPERTEVIARGVTGANGVAVLGVAPDLWRQRLLVRLAGGPGEGIEISRAQLDGEIPRPC